MLEPILTRNGLSKKEAKVYLTVLELGETPISRISSKTQLKRTTIYSIIESLDIKGMISTINRSGIKYVSALSPQVLIDRFKNNAMLAEKMLPELLQMAYGSPVKPRLKFFEGIEGIKQILLEFAQSQVPTLGFTDYQRMPSELFQFIRKTIVPTRKKNKNKARLLMPKNPTNKRVQKEDLKSFTEHRLIHFPRAENNPTELLLFEESKVAFLSFEKEEMFGIILDSTAIYKTLKNIFLLIWKNARQ